MMRRYDDRPCDPMTRWLLEPILAAAGFEIVTADFSGSV